MNRVVEVISCTLKKYIKYNKLHGYLAGMIYTHILNRYKDNLDQSDIFKY
jgi:hypothetical protein